jgi:2-oxoglutarate dehydrogenase complex dihydrolipoamide succinyltransferase (E2) component
MAISIVVPQLGESVAEGTVAKWLKAVGDKVRKEEPLVEIQTDKINVEIPAPADGVLSSIVIAEGTTVLVGTEIGQISGAAEAAAPAAAAPAASAPAATKSAAAASAAPVATATAAAPVAVAATAVPAAGNGSAQGAGAGVGHLDDRSLSPAVRKIMREQNVPLTEVQAIRGSGVAGRVTRDDLLDYLQNRGSAPAASAPAAAAAVPAAAKAPASVPSFLKGSMSAATGGPREETVAFSRVRKVISDNMVKAKHTAAHTHCFDEADMTAIVNLRKEWAPKLEKQGIKLTYMPFFIKAAVFALKEFPWMNSSVTPTGDGITIKHYYNIGIAVGRDEKGLIVPNLKDCDRKNLAQIAAEVNDIASRARADRLTMDEIQGGTFSISNAGVFGAINSAPVINVPEVAILGVHKIVERPVVKNGQIAIAPMMHAVIGFDHRAVDGELAVKFLRRVCELLEKPELLWFHV